MQVFEAICRLPRVETLRLHCIGYWNPKALFATPSSPFQFKNIYVRSSPGAVYESGEFELANAKGIIGYLIANTPRLEHLSIEPHLYREGTTYWRVLYFEELFAHLQRQPNFHPSLQSMTPGAINFPLSPNTMDFFANLSTLELPDDYVPEGRTDHVWPALSVSGIRLRTIKVKSASLKLVDYLHGYCGLEAFHLTFWRRRGYTRDNVISRLLTHGLPSHCSTLADLRILPFRRYWMVCSPCDRPKTMLWDIPGLLSELHRFRNLNRLDLVRFGYDLVDEGEEEKLVCDLQL